ncbi:MAG: serine/threonine-protein kinase [Acidobacteriota bacterium]
MTPARWRLINDLFHAVLARDAGDRAAFLEQSAAGDPDLEREVQTLLASHGRAERFLDEPAWGVAADLILGAPPASLAGTNVGSYFIVEEIGRGGMGVVYAADDRRLGRAVALKALAPEFTRDPVRRARLTREARAAAALSHPAIATIFALEEIDGELYIASELVRGRTLREEVRDGPLPAERLVSTLIDICGALVAAHDCGIVHRDLKPENVMRRVDGQIKVLDFGLARSDSRRNVSTLTRLTEAGAAMGTPGYMAPEQLSGAEVDARADIFAFGVLAWELATAEHPFGTDAASLLARMTELMDGGSGRLSRSLPMPALDQIARRCMRGAPAERYPTSAALLADLRALDSAGIPVPRVSDGTLWWWQLHQLVAATLIGIMPAAVWAIRPWLRYPYGSALFFVTLTLAIVSVTLRLNLSFTSRVLTHMLVDHRARLYPAIVICETCLAAALLGIAAVLFGQHDAVAALLLGVAVVTLASLTLIEPATTRAAGLTRA